MSDEAGVIESGPALPASGRREHLLKESRVFCMLPWTHLSLRPNGDVVHCCNAMKFRLGSAAESSLRDLWNCERMKRLRLNMLAGRESPECAVCYGADRCGLVTLRKWSNAELPHHFGVVEQTRPDGSLERLNLPYLSLRFSNTCNLRCRTCRPQDSTGWQEEGKLLGVPADEPGVKMTPADRAAVMRLVRELLPQAEIIHFSGGEPLVMDEHREILQYLASEKLFRVRLEYNTNFSVLSYQGADFMELWDRFDRVGISASLDGMGRRGEYLRKGLLWDAVVANRRRLAQVCPRVDFIAWALLSAMNAWHLPDFHAEWWGQGLLAYHHFQINPLYHPEEYCAQALPPRLKQAVIDKYERHIEQTARESGDAPAFEAAVKFMRAQDRSALLPEFRRRTLALDALRGERFAEVFPECAELVAEAGAA